MSFNNFDVGQVAGQLQNARREWRESQRRTLEPNGRDLPSPEALTRLTDDLKGVLFPMRLGPYDLLPENENSYVLSTLNTALLELRKQALLELANAVRHAVRHEDSDRGALERQADALLHDFASALPSIRQQLDSDVLAAFHGDPAAHSVDEVLLCYPGVLAMIHHRLAHKLYLLGLPLLARIVAEIAHGRTGIDIHPGAKIGSGVFIDHGTGVVIGETAVIGECVRIYQAVTLGAKGFPKDDQGNIQKGLPRHPIVEDEVVIYAGATILGRVTIGKGAVIGGNVWITEDVPAHSQVTQASSTSIRR